MNNRSHSWFRLTARHLVLVIVCLLTLSIGIPAFGGPPTTYTVTFDENASALDSVGTFEIGTAATGLTLFANLSPKFTNTGHTFTGWNTAANGTGTTYSNGATYSFSADIELFAQWAVVPTNYTVTFNENASALDSVGTFEIGTTAKGLTLFASLSPTFTNSGHTFTGWNTAANGTGTTYSNGATYSFSADIELFAQWAVVPTNYTVTFNENASASDSVTAFEIGTTAKGLTLFASLSPTFTNSGHTFTGWNTVANGTGTAFSDHANYSFSADTQLFAQWTVMPTFAASFDGNGGAGAVSSLSGLAGTSLSLPSSSGLSFYGYTFAGWNTTADGRGSSYASGTAFVLNANQILYAQWSPNQYVETFSPNGGSVNVAPSTYTYGGTTLTLPTPTNANATFNGWYSALTGGTLIGAAGASYAPGQTLTLYAQWTPNQYVVTYVPDGGTVDVTSSTFVYGSTPLTLRAPTNTNFTFNGWFTAPSGGALIGVAGASYQPTQSLTLYAQWTTMPLIVVSFASNGGSGLVSPESGPSNTSVTLPGSPSLARQGYTLSSWNDAPDGTGRSYALSQNVTLSTSLTLYAQWTALSTIELKFVTDGGSGSAAPLIGVVGANVTLPGSTSVVKSGFTFTSWNTTANGSGTSFKVGGGVTLSASMTLYAQWKRTPTAVLYGAVSLFTKSSTKLTPSLKTQIQQLAKTIKAKKYKKVTLFGYSVATGTTSLDRAISAARATVVADFLRSQLEGLKVQGVSIAAAGEGSIAGKTAPTYARVEVFVL